MLKPTVPVRLVNALLLLYVIIQLLLAMRQLVIPGDVSWTEEGHHFAWRVMLRSKQGQCYFKIINKNNDSSWIITPKDFLDKRQAREATVFPEVTWQVAQILKEKYAQQGLPVSVYAHCSVRLNNRPASQLIDTTVDLATVKWQRFHHNPWITMHP